MWAFIKCIGGEENRFNHLMIQMKGGLSVRSRTNKTQAIQQRINTLYSRYDNNEINAADLHDGLSYVVARNITSKRK